MKKSVILTVTVVLGIICSDGYAQNGPISGNGGKDANWEFPSKEDLARIPELPDPFLKYDGTRVQTPDEWPEQREYLKAMLSHYMYGTVPPAPHNTKGDLMYTRELYDGRAVMEVIKITFSPDDQPDNKVFFIAEVTRPNVEGNVPVIIWNQFTPKRYDVCPEEEDIVCNRHYAIVEYKRDQLALDYDPVLTGVKLGELDEALNGPLGKAYPGYTWGTIAMWSWGTSRVIDYLETTDYADMDRIVVTGHSRGAKTALHAAIYDERIAICAANGSGCGGAGCFRFLGSRLGEGYGLVETAGWIYDFFPYWWCDEFGNFGHRQTNLNHENMVDVEDLVAVRNALIRPQASDGVEEEEFLPFDLHFVRALIAPRALITTEGQNDTWANPYGSQLSWIAADEVFQFLGAKDRNAIHYREGKHFFTDIDWRAIADYCDKIFFDKESPTPFLTSPSVSDPGWMKGGEPNLHYSWRRPDEK